MTFDALRVDFDDAVRALRALDGQQVIVVVRSREWSRGDRPYRGKLSFRDASSPDVAVFAIDEPHDPRWTNPDGIEIVISRSAFADAERCGGPGDLGVSVVQGDVRVSVYPMTGAA